MSRLRYIEGVATLELDVSACTGCRMCVSVCPHGVLEIVEGRARIADHDACIECGGCVRNCAAGALAVDPGVGCAAAVIKGWLTGTEPTCGC